jgi:hypothetical protein
MAESICKLAEMAMLKKPLRIAGYICIAILAVLALLWWGFGPFRPSDQALEWRFSRHRTDLELLLTMMVQDSKMTRIASDFLWTQDSVAWPRPQSEWGIPEQRWEQYRKIFDQDGFKGGTSRDPESGDVEVIVWARGIVPAGVSLSYLYCGPHQEKSTDPEPPCVEKKDSGSGTYGSSSSLRYSYKKIAKNWYIYEQSN